MTRVLIVDDNSANLEMLRALLQGHGYEVIEARHGAEALTAARKNPPHIVISDLLMPVMDGYTLLRQWRSDEKLQTIPFIVYTATYTDPKDERLAYELGADAFILKPTEPEEFLTRLSEVQSKIVSTTSATPHPPVKDENVLLKSYNETLIRKLEQKMLQLEESNRTLHRDIAERRRTEEKLRESTERFRELAETIQEVFWITDSSHTRIIYVSPAYDTIWGRASAELYKSPQSWMEAVHVEDRDRVRRAVDMKQSIGTYDETYRIVRPDGSVRWIRDRAFPVTNAAGEVLRLVGTAEDITDRRQLEEQFHQSQKMDAIGQLATGVAHDFNNILAAILGNTQLALTDTAEDHPARVSLMEIKKASLRAKSLVQQILAFSFNQAQERHVIELAPIVKEAFNFLRATIPTIIHLDFSVDPATPPVLADATQIYQVITNLCTNACQAIEDHHGRIGVKIIPVTIAAESPLLSTGLRPGRFACLSVSDNGKGMDPATLARIFEPFFTAKSHERGTGLGLTVVQGIVQSHHGAIKVVSEPGQGATFHVYFPAANAAVEPVVTPVSMPPRGKGQHILYLDDEESLVFLAKRMLERIGYHISGFTRTEDALKAFHDNPNQFDLVIVDLNMPRIPGTQVAAELLKMRPDVPIALCSGHISEEIRQEALTIGVREVLYKPNTMEEFGNAIHNLASNSTRNN